MGMWSKTKTNGSLIFDSMRWKGAFVSKLIVLPLLVLLIACNQKSTSFRETSIDAPDVSVSNFDWLVGYWERTNDKADERTFEIWSQLSESEYRGVGFTIQSSDTIFLENIRLINRAQNWSFEVSSKGQQVPTVFPMTDYSNYGFLCENLENEFPKFIKYWKRNGTLNASVYNDDSSKVFFSFEKKQ